MLELRNVSCLVQADDKEKEILKNINLTLPDNKFIVVTGPNGGGKSTLARVISGIQKITFYFKNLFESNSLLGLP